MRWLQRNPAWLDRAPTLPPEHLLQDEAPIWTGAPPTLSNQSAPKDLEQMLRIAREFDVAGRDALNRAPGRTRHERAVRQASGRGDLARKVHWVSEEDGDGAGHDLGSFTPDGRNRLIEVKTTKDWERTPLHISRNEMAVAEEQRSDGCLFRPWNFGRAPKAFELHPTLDAHVSLTATTFQASFH